MSLKELAEGKYLVDLTWRKGGRRCRLRRQVFGSFKEVKEWEAKIRNAARVGKLLTEEKKAERPLFSDFAQEWLESYVKANNKVSEQRNKECHLRVHLLPFFGRLFLDEIGAREIEKYKARLISEGYAARTINLHLACLSKLFQSALDWGVVAKSPVRQVRKMRERSEGWQFLDFEEADRLLEAVPLKWYPLFLCALRTGMRLGEILGLQWEDVDFKRQVITVRNSLSFGQLTPTKSYGVRQIPMTQDLTETLLASRHLKSEFVFCTDEGKPLDRGTIKRPLRAALKRSGVKRIRFHDLRHTFASQSVMAGAHIKTVMELLGHADLKMTLKYSHLTPACRQEAIALLEARILNGRCVKKVTLEQGQRNTVSVSP